MIIKSLNIESFKKFKKRNINFSEGFNIIYGENESGKTSLVTFIRAMLYGLPNDRNKKETGPRASSIPFNDAFAIGSMLVEEGGYDYTIERIFGRTAREDTIRFYKNDMPTNLINEVPGEYFLGISEKTFEKILMIGEMKIQIGKDDNEEVIGKLSNLAQTSDEDMSISKAIEILQSAINELEGNRKKGLLSESKLKLMDMHHNRESVVEQAEKVKILKEKIHLTKQSIDAEINKLTEIENNNNEERFLELKKLISERDYLLSEEKANEISYDCSILLSLKNKLTEYKNFELQSVSDIEDFQNKKKILEEKESYLQKEFTNFEESKTLRDIEEIISLETAEKNISEKINLINFLKGTYSNENPEDISIKNIAINLSRAKNEKERILGLINEKKIRKSEDNNSRIKPLVQSKILENKNIHRKRLEFVFFLTLTSLIILFAAFYFTESVILKYVSTSISILFFLLLVMKFKYYSGIKVYPEIVNKEVEKRDKDEVEAEFELEIELSKVVNNYNELKTRFINEFKKRCSLDEYDICSISEMNIEELLVQEKLLLNKNNKIAETKQYYSEKYGSSESKFLLRKLSDFRLISTEFRAEYEKLEEEYYQINERLQKKQLLYRIISETLSEVRLESDSFYENDPVPEIDSLIRKIETLLEKERYLNEIQENIKKTDAKIDDFRVRYNIGEISVEEFLKMNETSEMRDRINARISELKEELHGYEIKVISKSKEQINLTEYDSEIMTLEDKISEMEQRLIVIKITKELLEETYQDMKKEFLPKLNLKLGEYLSGLTDEEISKVRIKNDFEIEALIDGLYRDCRVLSRGTLDMYYLGLRLAICDIIYSGMKVPVIFDDSLIHFDELRHEKAMQFLMSDGCGISDKQIIMFSCHKRELNYSDNAKVNVL